MFLKELRCNLQSGKFVALCDFAENYSFNLQDEAQKVSLEKCKSLHPSICNYFKKSESLNTEHENLVMALN